MDKSTTIAEIVKQMSATDREKVMNGKLLVVATPVGKLIISRSMLMPKKEVV